MSTEIHLNPTRLSILSISRDKYWIFVSSIQQLLYKSIEIKSGGSSEFADDNDISEDDELNEYSSCGSGSGSNTFTDSDFLTKVQLIIQVNYALKLHLLHQKKNLMKIIFPHCLNS